MWALNSQSIIEASFKEVEISKDILDSSKCYLLDCGNELYIWAGRNTSLDARKAAVSTVEVSSTAIICVTVFCSAEIRVYRNFIRTT